MWDRLFGSWVYGGAIFSVVLLSLMPLFRPALSHAGFLTLLCLPLYGLHQWEEHDNNRFLDFVNNKIAAGRRGLSVADSFVINIFGVWFLIAATVWLVEWSGQPGWSALAFFLLVVNGLAHVMGAVRLKASNPGLLTALVLFLPYGLWGIWQISTTASPVSVIWSLVLILVLHALIIAQAIRPKEIE